MAGGSSLSRYRTVNDGPYIRPAGPKPRLPRVAVMKMLMLLPRFQLGRLTISCIKSAISGVQNGSSASPIVDGIFPQLTTGPDR